MKVSELQGAALDWAVAKCEGGEGFWYDTIATHWIKIDGADRALSKGWAQSFTPSTNWAQGGPIIEREKIALSYDTERFGWVASFYDGDDVFGGTPLIAAMRCYCCAKLGDEIDIPEELRA